MKSIKNILEGVEKSKICGFLNGNWCDTPAKCKHRQRVYCKGPRDGISRKPTQYICYPVVMTDLFES